MNTKTLKISCIALFASLAYISFSFFQVKLILPFGTTSFHLGNTFAVLGALILGGKKGGIAASIGMGIGDILDPIYITVAPKTIILKFMIAVVTAYVAFEIFDLKNKKCTTTQLFLICGSGLLFNVVFEPIFSFIYSIVVFGTSTNVAAAFMSLSFFVTLTNATISCICSVVLYRIIEPKLKHIGLLNKLRD